MKYCTKCGNELIDEAVICTKCGCSTGYQELVKNEQRQTSSGVRTAAKVFMILGTVVMGIYIIPLAWCLPMTISYFNKTKRGETVSTGFKVCSLLFVSLLGGIFMLCDHD